MATAQVSQQLHSRIGRVPRLSSLTSAIAVKLGIQTADARLVLAREMLEHGQDPLQAARRNSAFVLAFRARHGLAMQWSEREPWQMTREEFDEAGFAIRQGEIDPSGAYFATPGSSTYYDTGSKNDRTFRYDLAGLDIANPEEPEVGRAILKEALNEPGRTEAERVRIAELESFFDEGYGCITYMDCDDLVLSWAAKRLGYDGIRVWENDDVARASSVFIWAVDRVDRVAQNHRVAVLEALRAGLPVPPAVRAEILADTSEHRFVLSDAIDVASRPIGRAIMDLQVVMDATLGHLGVDEEGVRVGLVAQASADAQKGLVARGLSPELSVQARELVELYSARDNERPHAIDAGGTVESVAEAIDHEFGAGFAKQLFGRGDFHLLRNESELPAKLRHPSGHVAGVYDDATGQTYLVAQWIAPRAVRGVLLHEIGVHYGLRRMLGERAADVIAHARRLVDAGHPMALAAKSKVPSTTHPANVDEEVLAHLVSDSAAFDLSPVARARAHVRTFLFRLGARIELAPQDMLVLAEGSLRRAGGWRDSAVFTLFERTRSLARKMRGIHVDAESQPAPPSTGRILNPDGVDVRAVAVAAAHLGVPERTVFSVLTDDVEVLRDRDRFVAPSNCMEPQDCPRYELGTPKIAYWQSDFSEAYVGFLSEFDPHTLVTAEHEEDIRRHPTFERYVEMLREGHRAPYIQVFEDLKGKLVASNRRRTLTAQVADVPVQGWRGKDFARTGLPLKYRDVVEAYAEALYESGLEREGSRSTGRAEILFLRRVDVRQTESKAFETWFGSSAIVHPDGTPMVAYHGTGADFTEFGSEHRGSATQASDARHGFFFAKEASVADEFAWKDGERGLIMPVYLSMQNPYVTDFVVTAANGREFARILEKARENGHDGVASFGEFLGKETSVFVVFEPQQIKSAMGNSGAFDPSNSDIRYGFGSKVETYKSDAERTSISKPASLPVGESDAPAVCI
jgi:hypothetical protein